MPPFRAQRGIALVVVLILLIVVTLLGLAAISGTTLLQKLTGNFYDRSIAFQSAEAGLQAAAQTIGTSSFTSARLCSDPSTVCAANPFTDAGLPAGSIVTVGSGTGLSQFTAGSTASSQPQYVIENMGSWSDPSSSTGYNQTANSFQYQSQGTSLTAVYYRITARSGDPAKVGDRAVVTLQAMYKQ
jgi:type IV pilus assembly protein PilX